MMLPRVTRLPSTYQLPQSSRTRVVLEDPCDSAVRVAQTLPSIRIVLQGARVVASPNLKVPFEVRDDLVLLDQTLVACVADAAILMRQALETRIWRTTMLQGCTSEEPGIADELVVALLGCLVGWEYQNIHGMSPTAGESWPRWFVDLRSLTAHMAVRQGEILGYLRRYGAVLARMQGSTTLVDASQMECASRDVLTRVQALRVLAAPVEAQLIAHGDSRLRPNGRTLANMYGSSPVPRRELAFGSCTASTPSLAAYAYAEAARQKIIGDAWGRGADEAVEGYCRYLRRRVRTACGLPKDAFVVLTPSGTDAELLATIHALSGHEKPIINVLLAPAETGSGVPMAAAGRRFDRGQQDSEHSYGEPAHPQSLDRVSVESVAIRHDDGTPRDLCAVDAEVTDLVRRAAADGKRALVHVLQVSKAGLLAPSLRCVAKLRRRYGETVQVLVDASQWRLQPNALRECYDQGYWSIITGSKFMSGAPFSGALLLPAMQLPVAQSIGIGVCLRWATALYEMDKYFALPQGLVTKKADQFIRMVQEAMTVRPYVKSCDSAESLRSGILSFALERGDRPLSLNEMKAVHRWLYSDVSFALPHLQLDARNLATMICHLGQPVVLNNDAIAPIVALRIALSARLVRAMIEGHDIGKDVDAVFGKLDIIWANFDDLAAFETRGLEYQ